MVIVIYSEIVGNCDVRRAAVYLTKPENMHIHFAEINRMRDPVIIIGEPVKGKELEEFKERGRAHVREEEIIRLQKRIQELEAQRPKPRKVK